MENEAFTEFENFDFETNLSFQNGWSTISNIIDSNRIGIEYLKAKVFFFSKYCKPIDLEKYLFWKKTKTGSNDHLEKSDGTSETRSKSQQSAETSNKDEMSDASASSTACDVECSIKSFVETNSTVSSSHSSSQNDYASDITNKLNSVSLEQSEMVVNKTYSEIAGDAKDTSKEECSENEEIKQSDSSSLHCASEDKEISLSLLEIATHIQNGIPIPGLMSVEVHPTNLNPTPSACARKPKPWEICVSEKVES